MKIGDKVIYRSTHNLTDVRIGEIVEVAPTRALPYGVQVKGIRLNCLESELQVTSKIFAKCLVVGRNTGQYFRYAKDFAEVVIENLPESIDKSVDIVMFTGGEDVNPYLYGETPHSRTFFNPKRDAEEAQVYRMAKARGIPCIGICRGAQFLNVMNKGRMIQHVTNHTNNHDMHTSCGHTINVTSTHHQMMDPGTNAELLGWAQGLSDSYEGLSDFQPCTNEDNEVLEPEVLMYKLTRDLCVQYHPETMEPDCSARNYLFEVLKDLKKL